MEAFYLNGDLWRVKSVNPNHPELVDRTGKRCVATTNPVEYCVYLSDQLQGTLFARVLIHELGHCTMISFDLLEEIHRLVEPDKWVEAEEFVCNFIADYGLTIFDTAYQMFGDDALLYIPSAIEKLVA